MGGPHQKGQREPRHHRRIGVRSPCQEAINWAFSGRPRRFSKPFSVPLTVVLTLQQGKDRHRTDTDNPAALQQSGPTADFFARPTPE